VFLFSFSAEQIIYLLISLKQGRLHHINPRTMLHHKSRGTFLSPPGRVGTMSYLNYMNSTSVKPASNGFFFRPRISQNRLRLGLSPPHTPLPRPLSTSYQACFKRVFLRLRISQNRLRLGLPHTPLRELTALPRP